MILAPVSDPRLRTTVLRAALPEEDVLLGWSELRWALDSAFPRAVVCRAEDEPEVRAILRDRARTLPVLALAPPTPRGKEPYRWVSGIVLTGVDDSIARLRSLLGSVSSPSPWLEGVLADLSLLLGRGVPRELRGLARRVMEFPSRYSRIASLEGLTGLGEAALRARFRRRGLPSPASYLRWFRLLAAARHLAELRSSVLRAAHFLGFGSDGNFCRWIRSTSGLAPSDLRKSGSREILLVRLMEECFPGAALEGWDTLEGMFLRRVA